MAALAPAERWPLERLQGLVAWAARVPEGVGAASERPKATEEEEFAEVETFLRQQNAANDEVCSENGRLRAEIERLRAQELAAESSKAPAEPEVSGDGLETELLDAVLAAVRETLEGQARLGPPCEERAASEAGTCSCEDGEDVAGEAFMAVAVAAKESGQGQWEVEISIGDCPGGAEDESSSPSSWSAGAKDLQERTELADAQAGVLRGPCVDEAAAVAEPSAEAGAPRQQPSEQSVFCPSSAVPVGTCKAAAPEASEATLDVGTGATEADEEAKRSAGAGRQACTAAARGERSLPESLAVALEPIARGAGEAETAEGLEVDGGLFDDDQRQPSEVGRKSDGGKRLEEALESTEASEGACSEPCRSAPAVLPAEEDAWQAEVLVAVEAAVRTALAEAAEASSALSPAEETALLLQEKLELRELVERQQERLEALETEVSEMESAAVVGSALGGALTVTTARVLSDAGSALSTGLSAVLAPAPVPSPKAAAKAEAATVGCEYEIISGRGAIVRRSDNIKSDIVAELAAGSRVRVMAISERYPRRAEIIFQPRASPADGGSAQKEPAEGDGEAPANPEAAAAAESGVAPALAAVEPVVGWISAASKDGRALIRLVPPQGTAATAASGVGVGASPSSGTGPEPEYREEARREVNSVTISESEWECVHQDHEASVRRAEVLTSKLNEMRCKLLQSFEMNSVLGELQLGVQRARDREHEMGETAALAAEEVLQRRGERLQRRQRMRAPTPPIVEEVEDPAVPSAASTAAPPEPSGGPRQAEASSGLEHAAASGGGGRARCEAVDWERLVSERETTAAALSVALQRLSSIQREAGELEKERQAVEGRGRGELSGMRATLRRLARPASAASSSGTRPHFLSAAGSGAVESLFLHRIRDLQREIDEMQAELRRATASEADLRQSVRARSSALRDMLRRGAMAGLQLPQCGPLRMSMSADAERDALRCAVEEQLQCNLRLRGSAAAPLVARGRSALAAEPG